jgi:hypothetical protein
MPTNPPNVSSPGPSRRSFLVAMGSTILGSFFLPALPSAAKSAAAPAGAAAEGLAIDAGVADRVRRLLAGPVWSKDKTVLVWTETIEERDKPEVMVWNPETDEEKAAAQRFFDIAMWRSWRTLEELHAILRQPGPWLIRQNFLDTYCFLGTTDRAIILDTVKGDAFWYDPNEAVRLTSEQALELIPYLMDKGYGEWTGGGAYLEPVKPEDARKNFRALRYPVT